MEIFYFLLYIKHKSSILVFEQVHQKEAKLTFLLNFVQKWLLKIA